MIVPGSPPPTAAMDAMAAANAASPGVPGMPGAVGTWLPGSPHAHELGMLGGAWPPTSPPASPGGVALGNDAGGGQEYDTPDGNEEDSDDRLLDDESCELLLEEDFLDEELDDEEEPVEDEELEKELESPPMVDAPKQPSERCHQEHIYGEMYRRRHSVNGPPARKHEFFRADNMAHKLVVNRMPPAYKK